jgi:hypothetical protein
MASRRLEIESLQVSMELLQQLARIGSSPLVAVNNHEARSPV